MFQEKGGNSLLPWMLPSSRMYHFIHIEERKYWNLIDKGSSPHFLMMFHLLIQLLSIVNQFRVRVQLNPVIRHFQVRVNKVQEVPRKPLQVYSRRTRSKPQRAPGTLPSDIPNLANLDLPIALRKNQRTRPTRYPIQNFVSYYYLSPAYRACVTAASRAYTLICQ